MHMVAAAWQGGSSRCGRDWPLLATGIAGAILLTADYSSSYQDALRVVLERNERGEAAFQRSHAGAP